MTDEEMKAAEAAKAELEAQRKSLEGKSVSELIEIIRETRSEAKERRLKEKELSERLAKIESDKTEEENKKKIEEGKQNEVIIDLQNKLKVFEEKAKRYDEYDLAKRTKLKGVFGEKWLPSFDKPEVIPLIELEDLASKIINDKSFDGGDDGKGKKKQPGKLEGLQNDLQLAIKNKDLKAQIAIRRMIDEEKQKK